MQFLVTGGARFIGSHITEQLVARGYRVRVLDNFSTGRHSNLAAMIEYTPTVGLRAWLVRTLGHLSDELGVAAR
jgi:nucleoside-diphosphate-sugar epimerase